MRTSQLVAQGTQRLGSAAESKTLLAHVLGVEPASLPLIIEVSDADAAAFAALLERRRAGEPVQHLTGRAFFRGVSVAVGPGVFIPRPETELLVQWALDALGAHPGRPAEAAGHEGPSAPVVVELCAGSGAISLALASECPGLVQYAVEVSDDAWPYLVRNVTGTALQPVLGDMADALSELDGTVDLVIANPPYIPESARSELPADVLRDPDMALFSGPDGLEALRVVASVAKRLLRCGGVLGAEHDDTHHESAPDVLRAAGFVDVVDHLDLAGRPRYVTARVPDLSPGRMGP